MSLWYGAYGVFGIKGNGILDFHCKPRQECWADKGVQSKVKVTLLVFGALGTAAWVHRGTAVIYLIFLRCIMYSILALLANLPS